LFRQRPLPAGFSVSAIEPLPLSLPILKSTVTLLNDCPAGSDVLRSTKVISFFSWRMSKRSMPVDWRAASVIAHRAGRSLPDEEPTDF
jgi:hypothetical protein